MQNGKNAKLPQKINQSIDPSTIFVTNLHYLINDYTQIETFS